MQGQGPVRAGTKRKPSPRRGAGARAALLIVTLSLLAAAPPIRLPAPPSPTEARTKAALDALVAAYPSALKSHDGKLLHWHAGPPTPIGTLDPRRGADAILTKPNIADIFAWPYPLAPGGSTAGDPGRARPASFFTRLYGDCRAGGVAGQLVNVRWAGGKTIRLTRIAGAAAALERVARDLDRLGPAYAKYLWPTAGSYNCRTIAGTSSYSMHAYGAAIDLNSQWGAYWRWGPRPAASATIPQPIIAAFERHGFIWGGKWAHFDSFHFEYRPELILLARQTS